MHLTPDRKLAQLEISGNLDADQVGALIAELSAMRATMVPPVPKSPPGGHEEEDAAIARAQGDPVVQVAVMRDGHTRFWVRHDGLGWFGFNLPVERASVLANVILDMTNHRAQPDLSAYKRRASDLYH